MMFLIMMSWFVAIIAGFAAYIGDWKQFAGFGLIAISFGLGLIADALTDIKNKMK